MAPEMTPVNEALRGYCTAVSFRLELTRTQVAVLVLLSEVIRTKADEYEARAENERLRELVDLAVGCIRPCPMPDVLGGFDLCPCGYGGAWPCTSTEVAWKLRGLDPAAESRRLVRAATALGEP